MPLEHHPLAREFPEYKAALQTLMNNAHFVRLAQAYQDLDTRIYQAEAGREALDDLALQDLKMRRVAHKDEIADLLRRAAE